MSMIENTTPKPGVPNSSAAESMKARLRADLTTAMRARNAAEVKLLRALVAAIDNAEAPPAAGQPAESGFGFAAASSEVQRLILGAAEVQQVLRSEIEEREHAAAEFDRVGRPDQAADLRAQADLARRYLD